MIPVSVSDILKILDQIPAWKAVVGLPKRIGEMERKIAALESQISNQARLPAPANVSPAKICPICDSTLKVLSETPHPQFRVMGIKIHHMKCESCDYEGDRDFTPGKGYK